MRWRRKRLADVRAQALAALWIWFLALAIVLAVWMMFAGSGR